MPCFVGEIDSEIAGLAGFVIEGKECRLIALDAARPGRGHGGALLQAVIAHARAEGCTRLLAWAGNHNLRGLAFLQKRGFGIAALLPGRLTAWRAANPGAIAPGDPAIAARDLLELSLSL
jgi:GNAT superfamily N-acetyltransferase